MHLIEVAPEEPSAANALWIGDTVLYPTAYPSTRQRLESHGLRVMLLEASEVAKAEGALTCCSLIFERQ
jgi:dimethylargininase